MKSMVMTVAVVALLPFGGAVAENAEEIINEIGVEGGLIAHLGCGDGELTAALKRGERYLVHGLDTDKSQIETARKRLAVEEDYGTISFMHLTGNELPYVNNLVNLVVASGKCQVPSEEIARVLAPGGVALFLNRKSRIGNRKWVKPWPKELDEWTHYLHEPDNNAVARDSVVHKPRSLQWMSEPVHGRSHEEMASFSAAVTSKGRVFYIADYAPMAFIRFDSQWKLVARDAFNGIVLWTRDIPRWSDHLRHFRAGPLHLPRRLVAVGNRVYATLGLAAPVTEIDAVTGKTLRVFEGTERTEEILVADGVLYLVVGTSEVLRRGAGLYARGEPAATKFRYITAVDIESGRQLWKHVCPDNGFVLPVTLTVKGSNVFYQSTTGVARVNASDGELVWQTSRATPLKRMSFSAPTVVATDEVLLCADREVTEDVAAVDKVDWGVHGWNDPNYLRRGKSSLRAYSIKDGRELWSVACREGYNSPVDVFVVGNDVWVGSDYKCYDLKTGKETKEIQWRGPKVGMAHPRCYRNKATEKFIYTCRSGIEVVSMDEGCVGNNSWIRGTCQYGIIPANGLLYAPPHACACFAKVKLTGLYAVAHHRAGTAMQFSRTPALEKGPAFGKASGEAGAEDWPMYRGDSKRSGVATTKAPASTKLQWSAQIGGRLTQAVVARGRVYVASVDTHTLHALIAEDGKRLWSFTAGARIDSAPTFFKGYVIFGCADGRIYSLDSSDGKLAWRFRAAPQERLAGVFGQLESVWPVHGAVQLQNEMLYAVAGRNSYLDGGMVLYRLNPLTGEELSRTPIYNLDPETDIQTGGEHKFDMQGVKTDIISGDGEFVYIKHQGFDRDGQPSGQGKPHLMSAAGILGEQWFVRSFWLIGTNVGVGWGGWADAAASVPSGRILCFDDDRVWGYGRVTIASGATGHKADAYHLFCKTLSDNEPIEKSKGKKKRRFSRQTPDVVWSEPDSLIIRAMVKAGDRLIVAGPPDLGKRDSTILQFRNEPEALAGFMGEKGVFLRVVSATDGKKVSECRLDAMPVFDGMSAANGRLYISLRDGSIECFGE